MKKKDTSETHPFYTKTTIDYPDLNGLKVMLIKPNDFYRKKIMGLGDAYVATAMLRCNINVSVLSCDIWSYNDIEIAKILIQSGIKIFAIGAMYPMIKEVIRICQLIRECVEDALIILGGPLPSPIPEFVLKITKADIAVIGESEFTIPVLMNAIVKAKDLLNVPGIAFIRDNDFHHTGPPCIPKNVTKDEIGWPSWDLFPIEKYITAPKFHPFHQHDRVMTISTGRGCPYNCNFCYRVCVYRSRPVFDILNEIEFIVDKYNVNGFIFLDDLVMVSEKRVKEFCEEILNRNIKFKYHITGRINVVNREILRLLKKSGCVSIFYGIESGNQKILDNIPKKITIDQIIKAIAITREFNIYCEYGLMFGQPGEDEKTLHDTVDLVKQLTFGEYCTQKLFGCIPFPGSKLYEYCKSNQLIKSDEDFFNKYMSKDYSLDQIPVNMTNLNNETANRLFKLANEELESFYKSMISKNWGYIFNQ
ncbi:MAG: B12-binding domain-containing radical SAM protein [Candidatus Magnetomorum sp.]|nr:B12-binding domain-containing radical SAM protein [Candidatus Magnetomorum sp.]